jgi:hypothetical protein
VRFRLVHKLATFLLAATALFTLGTSNVLPPASLVLIVLSLVFAWYADPEARIGRLVERGTLALNIVTLLFLAAAVFQVARSFPDVDLLPFLNFVIFLLALKLCQRRSNRDYLQVYVLSFLVMLAAAWLAVSVIFVVVFAIYVLLATWTLVLFHLRREIEENYIVRHASESRAEQVTATRVLNSRRVVGLPFFATTGAVALLVLLAMTALTGLVLLAVRATGAMGLAMAVHLGFILALFLVLPYSKMVHGVYRSAALLRRAAERKMKPLGGE